MPKPENKPIIAVDLDDVLAAHAPAFVEWSNKQYGTHLRVEDYHEHWGDMWRVDHEEWQRRTDEYFDSNHFTTYKSIEGARDVLRKLSGHFKLAVVTARRVTIDQPTRQWIDKYYTGIFDEIHLTDIWVNSMEDSIKVTKAEYLNKKVKADYFIDDQLKHILAAAEVGITSLLFGNYAWNQTDNLPDGVTRVKNWPQVLEYFKNESR